MFMASLGVCEARNVPLFSMGFFGTCFNHVLAELEEVLNDVGDIIIRHEFMRCSKMVLR